MPVTAKIKPVLKLDFTDFGCIDKVDNWFTRVLRRDFTVVICDKPDLLIFQEGGHLNRLYTCRKLFWIGESILPDWKRTDYALTCHYLEDPRNLRFPYYVWGSEATAAELIKQPGASDAIIASKTKFCSAVVSNANKRRTTQRVEFVKKLHARKPLESGGRFMNTIGGPLPMGGGPKLAFNQPCKFHLCYENNEIPGDTTESWSTPCGRAACRFMGATRLLAKRLTRTACSAATTTPTTRPLSKRFSKWTVTKPNTKRCSNSRISTAIRPTVFKAKSTSWNSFTASWTTPVNPSASTAASGISAAGAWPSACTTQTS